jgi:hypothetical protein
MPRGEHRKFREALRRVSDDRAKKYEREKKVLFHPADGSKAYYL